MLRLIFDQLQWSDEDMIVASRVMGPETASKGKAPWNPAVVRAMMKRGVLTTTQIKERMAVAQGMREAVTHIKAQLDLEGPKTLWPHQRIALAFMRTGHSNAYLLADEVGVGKTAPAILWAKGRKVERVLVLCRNSAKEQWRREIRRWTGEKGHIVKDTIAKQTRIAQRDGWVIAHWESLVNAKAGYLAKRWDVIIADEAHRAQNRNTQRADALFKLRTAAKVALTAHPYANAPDELWSILHWLDPDMYGSYWRFFGMHVLAEPKPFGGFDIKGARQPKLLRWELAPIMIRRTREQVRPWLPAITRSVRTVPLSARGLRDYAELKKQFFADLETHAGKKTIPIINMLARTTRLRQYLVDPSVLGAAEDSVKFPAIVDILEEAQRPTVIFTSFTQAGLHLVDYLTKRHFKTAMLHGAVKEKDRERLKAEFLRGTMDALIIQTQLGSESLNLGKYGCVAFLDLPWNARDLEQAEGRVDRPEEGTGISVPTTSYFILVEDSYEMRLQKKVEAKHAMFQDVFSVADLEELFA